MRWEKGEEGVARRTKIGREMKEDAFLNSRKGDIEGRDE